MNIYPRPPEARIFLFLVSPPRTARKTNDTRPARPELIFKKNSPPARDHVAPRAPRGEPRGPHISDVCGMIIFRINVYREKNIHFK